MFFASFSRAIHVMYVENLQSLAILIDKMNVGSNFEKNYRTLVRFKFLLYTIFNFTS